MIGSRMSTCWSMPWMSFWLTVLFLQIPNVLGGMSFTTQDAYVSANGALGSVLKENTQMDYGEDIGVPQVLDEQRLEEVQMILQKARTYLQRHQTIRATDNNYECQNYHELCATWAMVGECQRNPRFMNLTCPPVCGACESRITDPNCRHDPNGVDIWYPGDLDRMFERILVEHAQYDVRVLSRPYLAPGDTLETATYNIGRWIVTLEHFLTNDEADYMREMGESEGYTRAMNRTADQMSDDEVQHTGSTFYCMSERCFHDPVHQAIRQRMANITFIPESFYEHFQMIRYKTGEWFKNHNDFSPHHAHHPAGVRINTFLVYHSDVEEGGGTNFPPPLNMTVIPKKGRAVIFPCVHSEDPNTRDNQMDHDALTVIKGVKYAFNTHAHQREYMQPYNYGCGT